MPPRPAPATHVVRIVVRGSSHRQGWDEERYLKVLERLAAAEDLGAFVVEQQEKRCLRALGPVVISPLFPPTPGVRSPGHALLAAWVAASARGMQLAAQQLDARNLLQHSKAVSLLTLLVGALSKCFFVLTDEAGGSGREQVALSVLAVRAGVVKAHEQLSLRLTSIISRSQAASTGAAAAAQQHQIAPELASLASIHLDLFARMDLAWPGGACSPSLCRAVPAAADLTVAVLRSRRARVAAGTMNTAWASAFIIVVLLGSAYAAASSSVPAQIAGSSSVATLLLMWIGLAVERLHTLQRGLSPAAVGTAPSAAAAASAADAPQQQRLAVPAHHTQLLQALGVAAGGGQSKSVMASENVQSLTKWLGSLLETVEQQQRLADAAAAASCQQPLLLVLLECALLHPTAPLLVAAVATTLQHTLAHSGEAFCQLGATVLRAILEQDAGRRAVEAAAPAPATVPAAASVSDRAASNLTVLEALGLLAIQINTAVMVFAFHRSNGDDAARDRLLDDVAAVWLEHTAHYASLLEAGLRLMSCDAVALVQAACAARATAIARLGAGSGVVAADSQQQVFALLLSCLKASTVAADACAGSSSAAASKHAEQIWDLATSLVVEVFDAGARLIAPSSSSASSSSSTSNQTGMAAPATAATDAAGSLAAQLGCVLLARCLVAAGRLLQLPQATARDSSTQHMRAQSILLDASKSAATLLVQHLPQASTAAAAEPWLPPLLEEHASLEQQLESLQAQMTAASGAAGSPAPELQLLSAAALSGVAEQLQAIGAAACAALPVQQCCNHPDCRNLQQASELELVGGKTCVCGGCRVTRYCSRECQVAHYKGWHKAVCKRLQAQRQQQTVQQPPPQQQEQQQEETQQQQPAA